MKKTKLVVLGLTSILAISGCNNKKQQTSESASESESTVESIDRSVKSVTLNVHQLTLEEEGAANLIATIAPENALNKKLKWESSDEEVVMVSGLGKVRALAAGTATITVSSDEDETIHDTCEVRVNAKDRTIHVINVTLSEETLRIEKGDVHALIATVLPNNATDKSITWDSSDKTVATVENGVVTALAAGDTTITVTTTDGAKTASCEVTVTDSHVAVTSVSVSGTDVVEGNVALKLGEKITSKLTATVLPETASNKRVAWTSSDDTKVTVSASGQVTALAETTDPVTIKATSEDDPTKFGSVTVTVAAADIVDPTVHVSSISLGQDKEFDISHDQSTVLTAVISPSNAYDRAVSFEIVSGSDVVALGEAYGANSIKVNFLKVGQAVIKATSHEDNTITDEITLTISDSVNHITALAFKSSMPDMLLKSDTLALGNYIDVTTQNGEAATNPTLVYTSSNTSVASVNNSGQLTALHAGTTTITVTSVQDPSVTAATFELTVKNVPVDSVSITGAPSEPLDLNETVLLSAEVIGYNDRPVDNISVTWSVASETVEEVVTVSSSGLVTAKKEGTAVVRATAVKANESDEIKYDEVSITVRDSDTRIVGLRKQTSFTSFESEVQNLDNSVEQEGFTQNDYVNKGTFFKYADDENLTVEGSQTAEDKVLYRVGNQGIFQFAPIAQARDKNNQEKTYGLTDYIYTLEERDENGNFVKLSNSASENYVSSTGIDEHDNLTSNGFFTFKNPALNKIFRLNVYPNPYSTEFIVPKNMQDVVKSSIEFKVVNGYNAYSLAELSLFDNHQSFWTDVRSSSFAIDGTTAIPSPNSISGGIIMHRDISVLSSLLPSEMVLDTEAKVSYFTADDADFTEWCKAMGYVTKNESGTLVADKTAGREALLNSPLDYTTVFYRTTGGNRSRFEIEGNFFRVDSSSMKQIAALDSHSTDNRQTLMKGFNGDGSHSQLFGLNIDTGSPSWAGEDKDTVGFRNIQITGNSVDNTNIYDINKNKGGYILIKSGRANLEVENAIADHCFLAFMPEIHNYDDTNPQSYSSSSFDRLKCYDSYSNSFYLFGSTNNVITNSWLGRSGGAVVLMDECRHEEVTVVKNTPVYNPSMVAINTYMHNPVSGTEPWFSNHPGSYSMVKNYIIDAGDPTNGAGWVGQTAYALASQGGRTITEKDSSEVGAHMVDFLVLDMCIGGFGASGYASPELGGTFVLINEGETAILRPDNGLADTDTVSVNALGTPIEIPVLPNFDAADAPYRQACLQSSSAAGYKTYYPAGTDPLALINPNYVSFYLAAMYDNTETDLTINNTNRFGVLLGTYDMSSWA